MDDLQLPGELERGTPVAGYKIRQRIGAGPTGTVYAAVHPGSGRKVAIKVIHAHLTQAEETVTSFVEAVSRLTSVNHPGIVPLLEVGRLDGRLFLISEFAQGQPLTDLLASSGPLSLSEARPLLEALALILASAHGRGLVHGSLTMDNIWVLPREEGTWPPMVRVMDFGMGLLERPAPDTPYYLAPEQCRGEPPTGRSDVYALGVVAYQLLTGRLPFSSHKPAEVLQMHLHAAPRPPSELAAALDPKADALVLRALAKEPGERFQTMYQLRRELQRLGGVQLDPAAGNPETSLAGELLTRSNVERARPDTIPMATAIVDDEAIPLAEPLPPVPAAAVAPTETARPPDRTSTTGRLPAIAPRTSLSSAVLSGLLGLAVAAAVGVGAYRLLAGHWPWASSAPTPALGRLHVTTTPPGATVYLDNVPQQGKTPLTLPRLRQGQVYELFVHLSGYTPWRQTVALGLDEDERQLQLTLVEGPPRWGTLLLSASIKADFFLDTRRVGTQTRQVTLAEVRAAVDHQLRVVAPRHEPVEQTVRVEAGKVQVLQFDLQPLP